MAEWYLLQEGCNVGLFDYFQMFIRRIALQANDGLRRVEDGYAFCFAERGDFVAVENLLYLKICLVAKENLSHDPPHVVLRVRVEELHTPPFFRRWKTAKHQQLCVRRQKWPQRMTFYFVCGRHLFINYFDIETEWPETVVTTDHGAHGILHPTVEEVTFALRQRLYKRPHGVPRRRAQTFRTFAVDGDPLLSLPDIASVLNGVLVLRHQIGIDCLANGCDANFVHVFSGTETSMF